MSATRTCKTCTCEIIGTLGCTGAGSGILCGAGSMFTVGLCGSVGDDTTI